MTETTFSGYARLYDAIYADKDYSAESVFVLSRLAGSGPVPGSLLELGCGTGRHLIEFAKHGIQVVGVDMSAQMVEIARERLQAQPGIAGRSQVIQSDIRKLRLGSTFSAAVSLFHVMSYITDDAQLLAALGTIRSHLPTGGRLLFDFWHLPGVRRDPPSMRTRNFKFGEDVIERRVSPHWTGGSPIIDLDIEVSGRWNGLPVQVRERHSLRAWDTEILLEKLHEAGFEAESWGGGLADRTLSVNEWTGWVLAHAS
jgi:SAM-dependent methyltransferase